jgi:hypothetical protein
VIARPVAPGADIGADCKPEAVGKKERKYIEYKNIVCKVPHVIQIKSHNQMACGRPSMASANDVVISSGNQRSFGASIRPRSDNTTLKS